MEYEKELLKIFGLEDHNVERLELTFAPWNQIDLKVKILISDKHGEEVVRLLKGYEVKEREKDENHSAG